MPDEVVEKIEKEEEMKVSDFRLPQSSLAFLSDPGQHQPGEEFVISTSSRVDDIRMK